MAATETSMVYRIGANLDELKKNLAEGKAIITQVNADVAKLSGTSDTTFKRTGDGIRSAVAPSNDLHKSFQAIDSTLASLGINVGTDVKALEEMREAATGGAGALTGFATAGLAAGAAFAGWKIGRWISDLGDFDTKIGDATAKLLGFGDVAAQKAAAGAETLARASKLAGVPITDMHLAIELLSGAAESNAKAVDTSANRLLGWRQEIAKVKSEGNLSQLTEDIKSQNFSLEELHKRYGISVDAMQFFTREQQRADDAVAASNQRMLDNLKNSVQAQREQRDQSDKVSLAIDHMLLLQGRWSDVMATLNPKLVESVKQYQALGVSVDDMSTALNTSADKIQIVIDTLHAQDAVLESSHQKWKALEAAQRAACDDMAVNAQKSAAAQAAAFDAAIQKIIQDQQKMSSGNEITYDLSTDDGMAQFRKLNPSAFISPSATTEYFKTHTLQQAIAAGLIDLYAGFKDRHFDRGTDSAPGGMSLVGERGPEILNIPRGAQVIPTDRIGGVGGVTVNVGDVHVSGTLVATQSQLAASIGDAVMARMKAQGVRFPVTGRA
jgi:hypothetical protein